MTDVGTGLSVFGLGKEKGVRNTSNIKIIIVNTENQEAVEELSSYLSGIKQKLEKGKNFGKIL